MLNVLMQSLLELLPIKEIIMSSLEGVNPVAASGAKISTLYGDREVRVFPVLEVELSTISYMNVLSTLCMSGSGYFFDKVLNLDTLTIQYESPFFCISLACFVIGMFLETFNPQSPVEVIIIVSVIWLGFIVTTSLNGVLWEGEKPAAYFVNVGDKLATYICIGLIYYLVSQLDSIDQSPNVVITSETFSH